MERPARSRQLVTLLLVFGAVVFGMVLAGSLNLSVPSIGMNSEPASAETGARRLEPPAVAPTLPSFADLADTVLPAVVSVRTATIQKASAAGGDRLFDRFFRPQPRQQAPEGEDEFRTDSGGSGFFISADGWVVTNYHVIEDASQVTVLLNQREYPAEIRGSDPETDLALLKVDGKSFDYLALGDSEALRVGDWVMAVGSPLSFASSVSVGVVSGKGRSLNLSRRTNSFENFIQTDAAINRGNSGGPLVNLAGEVIGISTAMSFGAENIGFAVPADTLSTILPQLREDGKVHRGYLGVEIDNLDYKKMKGWGLDSTDGALVTSVHDGTPAAKAGLERGDIIFEVDDHHVQATRDLIDYVSSKGPDTTVELEILRDGKRIQKKVVLEARPEVADSTIVPSEPEEEPELEWLGIQYGDLSDDLRERMGVPDSVGGVVVTRVAPDSPLYDEGIQPFDILSEVNGVEIQDARDFEQIVSQAASGHYLRIYVQTARGGNLFRRFAVVQVP